MKQKTFPIIADDEIMLTEMPVMNLYDESDFISNIKGDYQDKNYLDWAPIAEDRSQQPKIPEPAPQKIVKSYAEQAREEARADLKKKRSASYLTQDVSHTRRHGASTLTRQVKQPTAPFQKENAGELAKYSQKLTQSHYILAENSVATTANSGKEKPVAPKKNNYDFLKKSQIYNKKANQAEQERRLAQELNLTRMSE